MRDIRQYRVAGAANRLEFCLVADDLHLQSVDVARACNDRCARLGGAHLQVLDGLGTAIGARLQNWTAGVAGTLAFLITGLQNIAAEATHSLLRRDTQETRSLRIEIPDD